MAELFRQRFRREVRQGQYVMHFAAEEALGKLDDGVRPEPIVVLSDINMPGMDDLDLLQEVKRRNAELPVIMVTAYGDDERRRKASEYVPPTSSPSRSTSTTSSASSSSSPHLAADVRF